MSTKKIYFPASNDEASNLKVGLSYDEKRLSVFTSPETLLNVTTQHPKAVYGSVVELEVPEESLVPYPCENKRSFGMKSGAVVSKILPYEEFEAKFIKSSILVWQIGMEVIYFLPFFW